MLLYRHPMTIICDKIKDWARKQDKNQKRQQEEAYNKYAKDKEIDENAKIIHDATDELTDAATHIEEVVEKLKKIQK